jgi:hypothetical protein
MNSQTVLAIILLVLSIINTFLGIWKRLWPSMQDIVKTVSGTKRFERRNFLPFISLVLAISGIVLILWPTTPPAAARIMYPTDAGLVSRPTVITGVSSNIPTGSTIWICVVPLDMPECYYPHNKPAEIGDMGEWIFKEVWIGQPDRAGEGFYLVALLADSEATVVFRDYVDDATLTGVWPPIEADELPEKVEELDRITVIRQ